MNLKSSKKDIKANRGITLIALVITIIVLLILAGVTIATLTGDNGLLQKASEAKNTNINAEIEEQIRLAWNKIYADSYMSNYTPEQKAEALETELNKTGYTSTRDNLTVTYREKKIVISVAGEMRIKGEMQKLNAGQKAPDDENAKYISGNYTAIIPAGFTVSNQPGESSIQTGLVIRDDAGNEFVWIPVGIPWKKNSNKTIELSRYTFGSDGMPTKQGADTIDVYYTELATSPYENAVAKTDVTSENGFIKKANAAGGFWIGRYEARKKTSEGKNKVTENKNDNVYDSITQPDAAIAAREMYEENSCFESDLINSYAWDTATLFLQEYDDRKENDLKKYSMQNSINKGSNSLATGTVLETNKDKICNVYDMASNCVEWTTETSSRSGYPCVARGDYYGDNSTYFTSNRSCYITTIANDSYSFRPILYIK